MKRAPPFKTQNLVKMYTPRKCSDLVTHAELEPRPLHMKFKNEILSYNASLNSTKLRTVHFC